jgi:hypothetical protein
MVQCTVVSRLECAWLSNIMQSNLQNKAWHPCAYSHARANAGLSRIAWYNPAQGIRVDVRTREGASGRGPGDGFRGDKIWGMLGR